MQTIQFEVNGQYIKRKDNIVPVAKCRNLYVAHFDFLTDDWKGTKTAIFNQGKSSKAQLIDDDGDCIIPWEFFDSEKETIGFVSVFCGDLVTANRASVKIIQSGYTDSDASIPPTPDIYQQILDKIDDAMGDGVISAGTFGDGLGKEE